MSKYKLWEALVEAKKYKWVDLTLSLNNDSPYWARIPDGSVELGKMCFDWGNEMLDYLFRYLSFQGNLGRTLILRGICSIADILAKEMDLYGSNFRNGCRWK